MSKPTPEPCLMCNASTGDHPLGGLVQGLSCGCEVRGRGLIPDPWHIHQCPTHVTAPEMVKIFTAVFVDKEHINLWLVTARALLARIEGK